MKVILVNKYNNKQQYFEIKKQTLNQSKIACPSISDLKQQNIYTQTNTQA